jgi:GTP pyrophosphokinase
MVKFTSFFNFEFIMTPQKLQAQVFKTGITSEISLKACEIALEAYNLPQQSHVHSVEVALILADLNLDEVTIIATLISDRSLEPIYSEQNITNIFGNEISELTKGIRKLNSFKEFSTASISNQSQSERMRQMLLAMTSDIRMMIVKLAYRVARLRNLKNESEDVRYLIANETQLIFAPLANRLGIAQLKWELEDLSFRYLKPSIYKAIAAQLDSKRTEREEYIETTIQTLKTMFEEKFKQKSEHFRITGRPKHIYSIWKKMTSKNVPVDELYDLRAVRIYVDSIEQCYEVLGMIHRRWDYVKEEFDDYIAKAKENGYQSIHTVIYGEDNKTVEIQIRTQEMHHNAEYGVAAHWRYKEGSKHIDASLEESINLVRQMLEYNDNPDLLNEISTELQSEHIYVMTPRDEVITLRKGSTPLDFAYYIHTQLGHRCRGAKVNGRIAPLTYQLKIGDKVEILTVKDGTPSRNWLNPNLNYLGTSRARTKVRSWFNQQDRNINIESGESLYNKEIKRLHAHNINLKQILAKFKIDDKSTFFENIGRGQINERQLNDSIQLFITPREDLGQKARQAKLFTQPVEEESENLQAFVIGAPQLQTKLAPCCNPTEKDEIVGYVTRGRGITVHSKDCNNILNLNYEEQQRLISVSWNSKKPIQEKTFTAELDILCFDRKNLLNDIFRLLSKFDINLTASKTQSDKKDGSVTMQFSIEINSDVNIGKLLDSLESINNVETVSINLN